MHQLAISAREQIAKVTGGGSAEELDGMKLKTCQNVNYATNPSISYFSSSSSRRFANFLEIPVTLQVQATKYISPVSVNMCHCSVKQRHLEGHNTQRVSCFRYFVPLSRLSCIIVELRIWVGLL